MDHIGNAKYIIKNINVSNVIFNCGNYNKLENELIDELLKYKIIYYSCIKELDIEGNKLEFLNTGEYNNENDNSNVIYFLYNNYKFNIGYRYNYIDLLLYNIKFKCYVVIDLKVMELNFNHTGQMQKYMNYIDKNVKCIDDNKTVGIIICRKNNQYVIDYCSDNSIIARDMC